MRLIDADKFGEDLTKLWDYSCDEGVSAIAVLKQALLALNNAPTVEPVKQCKYCKHCGNEDYCSNCHSDHSLFEYYERPQSDMLPVGKCRTCRHRDPEDKKCDCGALERAGCPFPVSDDYYCKYYEKGGAKE